MYFAVGSTPEGQGLQFKQILMIFHKSERTNSEPIKTLLPASWTTLEFRWYNRVHSYRSNSHHTTGSRSLQRNKIRLFCIRKKIVSNDEKMQGISLHRNLLPDLFISFLGQFCMQLTRFCNTMPITFWNCFWFPVWQRVGRYISWVVHDATKILRRIHRSEDTYPTLNPPP